MLKSVLSLAFMAVLCNACVTSMSQQDLDDIHSVQLLTDFEDSFYITEKGLTVFENDGFKGDITEWKLKKKLLDALKAEIPSTIKIVEEKSFKTGASMAEGWDSLAEEFRNDAQSKKADTVIVLSRNGFYNPAGGGFWEVQPERGGFGFYNKSLFGKPMLTCPFLSYFVSVYRVSDGKHLASEHDTVCINQNTVEIAQEFSKYSSEQKAFFKSTIEETIKGRFAEKIRGVFSPAEMGSQMISGK